MDSTPGPGLRSQTEVRTSLRLLGGVLLPAGLLLLVVGIVRFANADPGVDGPDGLLLFALGGVMAVVGFGLLATGFLGAQARYAAGETVPVLEDSLEHLTSGPHCRHCGVRNDEAARFCDSCGQSLA